jgi:2-oxo-4-hydroxy-4-carboxy-5-ureidoimidazoline decarboxylase
VNLEFLNNLSEEKAREELFRCCASNTWVSSMLSKRPFQTATELFEQADLIWFSLDKSDWLEAFQGHPKIGDVDSLKKKYSNTQNWTEGEQAGVAGAQNEVIEALASGNTDYEEKYGYIFIVCATGKTAEEMLEILNKRLLNSPEEEIKLAAAEQAQITKIRLEKLS